MLPAIERVKGIHPGAILKRELKKRGIKSIELAKAINEHAQTINAITKERRGMNAKLSLKLGNYFNISHEYFMFLQAAYEVNSIKLSEKESKNLLLGKFRKSVFWDTQIEFIDYKKHKRSVIQRVLERGNSKEIEHLIKIYSLEEIKRQLPKLKPSFVSKFKENIHNNILHKG